MVSEPRGTTPGLCRMEGDYSPAPQTQQAHYVTQLTLCRFLMRNQYSSRTGCPVPPRLAGFSSLRIVRTSGLYSATPPLELFLRMSPVLCKRTNSNYSVNPISPPPLPISTMCPPSFLSAPTH